MSGLFQKTKRWLRKQYPVPFRVRVYVLQQSDSRMQGACGWFLWREKCSIIYIAETFESSMSETLLEEWAHALRHAMPLEVDYDGEPHDAYFWTIYGQVTNAWRQRFLS